MPQVRKAVITAAGKGTRQYPASTTVQKEMFPLVDRDGLTKPTLQIIAEEAFDAGIEELGIVISPGDEESYRQHFAGISEDLLPSFKSKAWAIEQSEKIRRFESAIHYITQPRQEGYGHAVWCAKEWVGNEPVLLLLGDHIYISDNSKRCAQQLIEVYEEEQQMVLGVKPTHIAHVPRLGTLRGEPLAGRKHTYRIEEIIEKPSPEVARSQLVTPGLAQDRFLCFFGMYILTPAVFEALDHHVAGNRREHGEIQLSSALDAVAGKHGAVGYEIRGQRYDMGIPFGYVETQLALALHGSQRDEIIGSLQHILRASGDEVVARIVGR